MKASDVLWTCATDPLDAEARRLADIDDDVRWRVVQTAEAIVGYRF